MRGAQLLPRATLYFDLRSPYTYLVAERADYPADLPKLKKLLLAMGDAKIREEKTSNPDSYAVIGVEDPSQPGATGTQIELTALEFRLLSTFMERAGRVQTREQLLRDVWEMAGDLQTRTVDTHVKRLREKLGAGRELIETVRGIGYRMVEP